MRSLILVAIGLFIGSTFHAAFADPSPAPSATGVTAISGTQAAVAVATVASAGLIASKGGLMLFVLLIVGMANAVLSGIRTALYAWDGVNQGDAIPPADKALTTVNKICLWLGTIIDYLQGNTQH